MSITFFKKVFHLSKDTKNAVVFVMEPGHYVASLELGSTKHVGVPASRTLTPDHVVAFLTKMHVCVSVCTQYLRIQYLGPISGGRNADKLYHLWL